MGKIFSKGVVISLCIIIVVILVSIFLYPSLPERMISHWGAQGEVNGYMGKFWGTFFTPLLMLIMVILLVVFPRLDPKQENIARAKKTYDGLIIILTVFFAFLQGFILGVNLHFPINSSIFFPLMLGALFICIGFIVERVEQNWTIGIRTPWTLSSESVWNKTHKFGGKIFKLAGIFAVGGAFFPKISFLIFLIPVFIGAITVVFYSYFIFKTENKI